MKYHKYSAEYAVHGEVLFKGVRHLGETLRCLLFTRFGGAVLLLFVLWGTLVSGQFFATWAEVPSLVVTEPHNACPGFTADLIFGPDENEA